ncbi:MAG: N-acetylmuramoyl-L-alanine amidase [Elusimicrobiales bacterium]|nr:N-acetylmuramoyl-L-alanine amidase [Elusimicrobiales bacterium]
MTQRLILLLAAITWGALPRAQAGALDDLPALSAAEVPAPPAAAAERARTVICVDPGHPNTFNSATDLVNGTNENRINWQVGQRLERVLKEAGYEVVMTRNAELHSVENKDRARICNAAGAALAVHLHCESTLGTGFALYYPDRQGVYDYKNDPENGFRGPSAQVREDSRAFSAVMFNAMRGELAGTLKAQGMYGDSRTAVGSNQGALTFSIFSEIPTLTIEMVVLTNKKDAEFIKAAAGQEKMAAAIAAGIRLYRAP